MTPPLLLSSENILQTPRWWVRKNAYRFDDGKERTRFCVVHRPGAVIIPYDGERFLLVEQYRLNIEQVSLEFPMGGVDEGEIPEVAAKRELAEETGVQGKSWESLGQFANANGSLQHWLHLFLVKDLDCTGIATPEPSEIGMRTLWATKEEIQGWIRSSRINDGKTLAAWSCYQAQVDTIDLIK